MKSTYPIIGEFSLCRTKSHVVLFIGISSWFFIFSANSDFHHIRVLSCACVYTIVQFCKRVHGKRNVTNLRITIVIIVLRNLRMRRGLFLAQINSHCSVAVTCLSFVVIWFDIVSLCDFFKQIRWHSLYRDGIRIKLCLHLYGLGRRERVRQWIWSWNRYVVLYHIIISPRG